MLAYLGCVTGIVTAMVMSCAVLLSTPDQPASSKPAMATVAKYTPKTATAAKPQTANVAMMARVPPRGPAATAVGQTLGGADDRQKPQTIRANARRLVQEERARRWAYQQDQGFESRFLSYAD
jgi:hypothetical protein